MRYAVTVTNKDFAMLEIVAKSKEDAEDIAFEMFVEGLIRWDDNCVEFDVREVKDGTEEFLD